jgi:hypothetical protein
MRHRLIANRVLDFLDRVVSVDRSHRWFFKSNSSLGGINSHIPRQTLVLIEDMFTAYRVSDEPSDPVSLRSRTQILAELEAAAGADDDEK